MRAPRCHPPSPSLLPNIQVWALAILASDSFRVVGEKYPPVERLYHFETFPLLSLGEYQPRDNIQRIISSNLENGLILEVHSILLIWVK